MSKRTHPLWVIGVLLLITSTGCSQPITAPPEPPPTVTDPTTISEEPDMESAVKRIITRVNQVAEFNFEGFERKGPPRSQIATVPPIWTGEKVRGEGQASKLGEGAVLLFATPDPDESLIIVDIAYVEGLSGTGFLRTAWLDQDMIARAGGACTGCTGHRVVQFYEPQIVYTVTAIRTEGQEKWFYPFTQALMQYLRNTPLTE